MNIQLKVCGLREPENIQQVVGLNPNYIGFIFYPGSPRFLDQAASPEFIKNLPDQVSTVGVFVNEDLEFVKKNWRRYEFDYLQLHGSENREYCLELQKEGAKIIKAFSVDENFDFDSTKSYEAVTSLYLFDTKTSQYGGSGLSFNWNRLHEYQGNTNFLVGGGISTQNALEAMKIGHPKMIGIDVNSRFEIEPGLKNLELLKELVDLMKTKKNKNTTV